MRKHTKLERWYMKYLIQSSIFFYTFLFIGIALFLALSLTIKMENGQTLLWQIFMNAGNGL